MRGHYFSQKKPLLSTREKEHSLIFSGKPVAYSLIFSGFHTEHSLIFSGSNQH